MSTVTSPAPCQLPNPPPKPSIRDVVPVTLRLEYKGRRIADKFLWNSGEEQAVVAEFARTFCQDHGLFACHAPTLAAELSRQVGAWLVALPPASTEHEPGPAPDLQTITLDCIVGNVRLQDRFQWDVSRIDPQGPEIFAQGLCRDLGLHGPWPIEVAIAVRHQLALLARQGAAAAVGGVGGGRTAGGGGAASGGEAASGTTHPPVEHEEPGEWGPRVTVLTREELAALISARSEASRGAGASATASDGSRRGPGQSQGQASPGQDGPSLGASPALSGRQLRKRRGARLAELVSSELAGDGARPVAAPGFAESPPGLPRQAPHAPLGAPMMEGMGAAAAAAYAYPGPGPAGQAEAQLQAGRLVAPDPGPDAFGIGPAGTYPVTQAAPRAPPVSQFANLFPDMF
ncbi:hypothetical protein ACKKBG_A15255 [Auxenochlorella protothecoides x Auxenochlorella symbiontica]